ncbi:high mobility group nucleosome-binding domain-containing protein 3 isoform X6 [Oreochromis niloticus]|uniref:high mobility group nucleosome-binding domain-containing protein 3 isoform X6 n=1 Tax=Oreochromis niloticus TaxID=8128 RepID=UPI000DF3D0C2|nr:high mobility group nucleosome-binding domain-containing protein 3 isoform X6 [Oreochromis niloticus]
MPGGSPAYQPAVCFCLCCFYVFRGYKPKADHMQTKGSLTGVSCRRMIRLKFPSVHTNCVGPNDVMQNRPQRVLRARRPPKSQNRDLLHPSLRPSPRKPSSR